MLNVAFRAICLIPQNAENADGRSNISKFSEIKSFITIFGLSMKNKYNKPNTGNVTVLCRKDKLIPRKIS